MRESSDAGSLIGRHSLEIVEPLRWACDVKKIELQDSTPGRQMLEQQPVQGRDSSASIAGRQTLDSVATHGGGLMQQPMQARESSASNAGRETLDLAATLGGGQMQQPMQAKDSSASCLLYTSDAADE